MTKHTLHVEAGLSLNLNASNVRGGGFDITIELSDAEKVRLAEICGAADSIDYEDLAEPMPDLHDRIETEALRVCGEKHPDTPPVIFNIGVPREIFADGLGS